MNQKLLNKIEAKNTSINALLKDQKFTIDYFQREYRWQEKHIKLLVEDLTTTFLKSYDREHKPQEVENYQNYYLGPVVFSVNNEGKKSIIDGQQRITSITLLLIYLNHKQQACERKVSISELVFSEKYGNKSFNMTDEMRTPCLRALFEDGTYIATSTDEETVLNMTERYADIEQAFPEEIDSHVLPYFIDWLIENVVLVEITAYSDENAYTIFETMNDRGLNLTPTEMLKGYILSKITDKKQRSEINDIWKREIQKLHEYDENADLAFFQAWFRGKFAVSIRPGKAGSEDQDFELIGSRFHSWFRDNHKKLFRLKTSDEFYRFCKNNFPFFVNLYLKILKGQQVLDVQIPHVYYIKQWGIAESLQNALLLAPIKLGDDEGTIQRKLDFVARYIETFTVRRAINSRKFGQTAIKYTMFNVAKLIRDNEISVLGQHLTQEVGKIAETWGNISNFQLNGMNRKFVKHLLSRISSYVDNLVGKGTNYTSYYHPDTGKQFEIEHLWADKFSEHKDEFEQETAFQFWRNSIGALILLPQGTNQSFSSDKYEDKLEHYLKENTYAQTLHQKYYIKNPNFLNSEIIQQLGFKAHPHFKMADLEAREALVGKLGEKIWPAEFFAI